MFIRIFTLYKNNNKALKVVSIVSFYSELPQPVVFALIINKIHIFYTVINYVI